MSWIELFFSFTGRIRRRTFWFCILVQWTVFLLANAALGALLPENYTVVLVFPFLWSIFAVATRRHHDLDKSGFRLLLFLIPILGVAWVWFELGFRKGADVMRTGA